MTLFYSSTEQDLTEIGAALGWDAERTRSWFARISQGKLSNLRKKDLQKLLPWYMRRTGNRCPLGVKDILVRTVIDGLLELSTRNAAPANINIAPAIPAARPAQPASSHAAQPQHKPNNVIQSTVNAVDVSATFGHILPLLPGFENKEYQILDTQQFPRGGLTNTTPHTGRIYYEYQIPPKQLITRPNGLITGDARGDFKYHLYVINRTSYGSWVCRASFLTNVAQITVNGSRPLHATIENQEYLEFPVLDNTRQNTIQCQLPAEQMPSGFFVVARVSTITVDAMLSLGLYRALKGINFNISLEDLRRSTCNDLWTRMQNYLQKLDSRVLATIIADRAASARAEEEQENYGDDIEVSHQIIPLTCPLSLMRLQKPCKTTQCTHAASFELSTCMEMMTRKVDTPMDCPICQKAFTAATVIVDVWTCKMLLMEPNEKTVQVSHEGVIQAQVSSIVKEKAASIQVFEILSSDDDECEPVSKRTKY